MFSGPKSHYTEFEAPTVNSHELIVDQGVFTPMFSSLRSQRISRWFKMKSRDGYSGYWYRRSHAKPLEDEVPGQRMNDYVDHFLDRWIQDFGKDKEAVNSLRKINRQSDPIRKMQFGVKMEDVPWGSVILFDGSSKLRTFSASGRLEVESLYVDPRSDLEIRYPDLQLPERLAEQRGEDVKIFFLGMLSSLKEVAAVIPDVYHRVALVMLMKLNPDLLIEVVPENTLQNDYEIKQQLARDPFRRIDEPAPIIEQEATRSVRIDDEAVGQALMDSRGVRVYGSTHVNSLEVYLKQGWQVYRVKKTDNIDSDMRIIYFDVYEFVLKYLKTQEFDSDFASTTEKGLLTSEYSLRELRAEKEHREMMERYRRAIERAEALRRARRSL